MSHPFRNRARTGLASIVLPEGDERWLETKNRHVISVCLAVASLSGIWLSSCSILNSLPGSESAYLIVHHRSRLHTERSSAMQRRRFKNTLTFPDRLAKEAERFRQEAETTPPGQERDDLLRKARQAETAAHLDEWLSSPGLKGPTP